MDERNAMTEFVGPKEWPGINCVLKRLYSDFIVIEIPTKDEVLKPWSTDQKPDDKDEGGVLPPSSSNSKADVKSEKKSDSEVVEQGQKRATTDKDAHEPTEKRVKDDEDKDVDTEEDEENGNQDDEKDEPIPDLLSEQDLASIVQVCDGIRASYTLLVKAYSKEQRRIGYDYLRKYFNNRIIINSGNGEAVILRWNEGMKMDPRDDRAQNRSNQKSDENNFPRKHNLFFTMTKVNRDTNFVVGAISRASKLNSDRIQVAGLKDRRAITTQQMCAIRVPIQRIRNSTRNLRDVYFSNFRYEQKNLQLGDLWGNHFEIALREFDLAAIGSESALAERIDQWTKHGFLNYFGSQRFGSCGVNTADVGRHILAGRWEKAVDTIMTPRDSDKNDGAPFIHAYNSPDRMNAIKTLISRFRLNNPTIEETIVRFLAENPGKYKEAIMKIRREMRSLYVHAYQSHVFNSIISRRCQKYGTAPIAGDLNKEGQPLAADAESTDIHYPLPSILQSAKSGPQVPTNEIAEWYKEISAADGITEESFKALENQCIVGNVLRPLIIKPTNVSWELVDYMDPRAALQTSAFIPVLPTKVTAAVNKSADTDDVPTASPPRKALLIRFDLPAGCYATMALRELLRVDLSKDAQKRIEGIGKELCVDGQGDVDTSGTSGEPADELAEIIRTVDDMQGTPV